VLIRNPSARLAWSELNDDLLLFASSCRCELLKLVCAADALHIDNLGQWLQDEDGLMLISNWSNKAAWGSPMNKISVRLADWHKDNADIRRIRSAVFVAEQSSSGTPKTRRPCISWPWKATTRSVPPACCLTAPSAGCRCSRTGAA
jgi:hypothetical protein